MNVLEERLKHSNSAVVLGATKVFLNLTMDMPAVQSQVRSLPPLGRHRRHRRLRALSHRQQRFSRSPT